MNMHYLTEQQAAPAPHRDTDTGPMTRQESDSAKDLHELCLEWARWTRTRKFFAPNRLDPSSSVMGASARSTAPKAEAGPDGPCSAKLHDFNLAVSSVRRDDSKGYACFMHYYLPEYVDGLRKSNTPVKAGRRKAIKVIAAEMGISCKTFYNRSNRFAEAAQRRMNVFDDLEDIIKSV